MKWISAEDRLPEKSGEYIIYLNTPVVRMTSTAFWSFDVWVGRDTKAMYDNEIQEYLTHWMPLPDRPEVKP